MDLLPLADPAQCLVVAPLELRVDVLFDWGPGSVEEKPERMLLGVKAPVFDGACPRPRMRRRASSWHISCDNTYAHVAEESVHAIGGRSA